MRERKARPLPSADGPWTGWTRGRKGSALAERGRALNRLDTGAQRPGPCRARPGPERRLPCPRSEPPVFRGFV